MIPNLPVSVYQYIGMMVVALIVWVAGVGASAWIKKRIASGLWSGEERRKDGPPGIIIDKDMLLRAVSSWEAHIRNITELVGEIKNLGVAVNKQTDTLESHAEIEMQILREINARVGMK